MVRFFVSEVVETRALPRHLPDIRLKPRPDLKLAQAKARIWPRLSHVFRIRLTAACQEQHRGNPFCGYLGTKGAYGCKGISGTK